MNDPENAVIGAFAGKPFVRNIPFKHERLKSYLLQVSPFRLKIFIFYSGAITGAITTPLDVMKTRLMVQVNHWLHFFSRHLV